MITTPRWFTWPYTTTFNAGTYTLTTYYDAAAYQPAAPVAPPPVSATVNPYAADPDARHLARIKAGLAAPWPPRRPT